MDTQQQDVRPSFVQKIRNFITECKRVIVVTRKPEKAEFSAVVKVTGLGILLIGAIGFIVQLISTIFIKQ